MDDILLMCTELANNLFANDPNFVVFEDSFERKEEFWNNGVNFYCKINASVSGAEELKWKANSLPVKTSIIFTLKSL